MDIGQCEANELEVYFLSSVAWVRKKSTNNIQSIFRRPARKWLQVDRPQENIDTVGEKFETYAFILCCIVLKVDTKTATVI